MLLEKFRMFFHLWRRVILRMRRRNDVSPQRLAEIEKEFNEKMAQGWFAADISDRRTA